MTEKWQNVPGMPGVRVARIDDGELDDENDMPSLSAASHTMFKVIIDPGSSVDPLGDVHAVNLHVLDGALRISISDGDASVICASGGAIQAGDADIAYCDRGTRTMQLGESAVLRSGNNFTIRDGVMNMAVDPDTGAEFQMSVVKKSPDEPDITPMLCWICPFT